MNKTIVQIIKNTITSWGMVAVQAAIGLVMVPFLLGKLGTDGYGAIGILISIIGFAEVADLGLRAALNRELSEKVAHKDINGFRQLSSSALVLYLGLALIISVIGIIIAPFLCNLFRVGDAYRDVMILLLRTYAPITILLSFITPVFTAGICSFMRYDIQNNVAMCSQLLISALLFICLSIFDSSPLITWCAVMAFGGIIRLLVTGIFYRKTCFEGRIGLLDFQASSLIPLFKLGWGLYLVQLTQVLEQRFDPLIISRFIGLNGVAIYQTGIRLPQLIFPLVGSVANQMVPLTTKFHIAMDSVREANLLIYSTRFTMYIGAIFYGLIIIVASPLCNCWLFDKFGADIDLVVDVLRISAVLSFSKCAGSSIYPVLLAKKKLGYMLWLNIPCSIVNIIGSYVLVGILNMGVSSVLFATLIVEALRRTVATVYVPTLVGLTVWKFVKMSYILPCSLFLLVTLLYPLIPEDLNWAYLFLNSLVVGLLAVFIIALFEYKLVKCAFLSILKGRRI